MKKNGSAFFVGPSSKDFVVGDDLLVGPDEFNLSRPTSVQANRETPPSLRDRSPSVKSSSSSPFNPFAAITKFWEEIKQASVMRARADAVVCPLELIESEVGEQVILRVQRDYNYQLTHEMSEFVGSAVLEKIPLNRKIVESDKLTGLRFDSKKDALTFILENPGVSQGMTPDMKKITTPASPSPSRR